MESRFLRKQISRREMLGYSTGLAGSAPLMHFFSAGLLGASAAGYAQQVPSPADLLADMRARFNSAPLETQRLGQDVTMLSGPGGSVVVLNGPRRQIRRGHFRCSGLAQAQKGARRPRQRSSEMGH